MRREKMGAAKERVKEVGAVEMRAAEERGEEVSAVKSTGTRHSFTRQYSLRMSISQ